MRLQIRYTLRAADWENRESADRKEISDFFIFCQDKPFGKLFSKITIKLLKEFSFWRNFKNVKWR